MQDLSKLSNEELVALYRSLGGVIHAGKFRTKAQGISKIEELQAQQAPTAAVEVPAGYTVLTSEEVDAEMRATRNILASAVTLVTLEAVSGVSVESIAAEVLEAPAQQVSKRAFRANLSREARKQLKRQVRRERKAEGRRTKSA